MRKITLTRRKAFAACLAAFKIYVTDESGDTVIGKEKCRFITKIKNNETVSFDIDENATKIYVIADSLSKSYCMDCYPIASGANDLEISGICKFNPFLGNPFIFDNVTDPIVLENRKRIRTKGIIFGSLFLVACVVIGFICGVCIALL